MTASIPTFTTAQLILRPLEVDDADAIQALFPRWEIVRYLTHHVPWPYPPDGALSFIRDSALPAMREGREWHWSIRLAGAPEQLIGAIGLLDRPGDNRGFWLDPAHQGQGLMSEACAAVTGFWFETLERPVLRVLKAVANVARFRARRNAVDRDHRVGLRVRPSAHRGLGNHPRRMARAASGPPAAGLLNGK